MNQNQHPHNQPQEALPFVSEAEMQQMAIDGLGEMAEHQIAVDLATHPYKIEGNTVVTPLVSREGHTTVATRFENGDLEIKLATSDEHREDKAPARITLRHNETGSGYQVIQKTGLESSDSVYSLAHSLADSVPVSSDLWERALDMYSGVPTTAEEQQAVLDGLNRANEQQSKGKRAAQQTAFSKEAVTLASPQQPEAANSAPIPAAPNRKHGLGKKAVAVAVTVAAAAGAGGALLMADHDSKPAATTAEAPHPAVDPEQVARDAQKAEKESTKKDILESAGVILDDLANSNSGAEIYRGYTESSDVPKSHWGNKRALVGDDLQVGTPDDEYYGPELHASIDSENKRMSLFEVAQLPDGTFRSVHISLELTSENPGLQAVANRDLTPEDFRAALADSDTIIDASVQYEAPGEDEVTVESGVNGVSHTDGNSSQNGEMTLAQQIAQLHTQSLALQNTPRGKN